MNRVTVDDSVVLRDILYELHKMNRLKEVELKICVINSELSLSDRVMILEQLNLIEEGE